jgi:hypothetical protein
MTFQLTQVVPWGRSFEEYVAMFALSEENLRGSILSCADGPSSFNSELSGRGGTVVSIDPLYDFKSDQIKKRIEETFEEVIAQTRKNMEEFAWKHISSVEELGRVRMEAMHTFLSDYDRGKSEGRYLTGSLPSLSFPDNRFALALCSHFLFLYSNMLDLQFHISAIREMCRVAKEARIFPLLQLGANPSPHVPGVVEHFRDAGYKVDIVTVIYEFQRGGNKMLRIVKA